MHGLVVFRQTSASFWQARTAQERQVIRVVAVLLLGMAVYLLAFDPALKGRTQLNKDLPVLRLEAAEMKGLAKQASEFSAKAGAVLPPMTAEGISNLLNQRGMRPQSVTLTGDFAKVVLADVPFAALMSWLAEIQKTSRISVAEANIVGLPAAGSVNANLTLRQQKSEQK